MHSTRSWPTTSITQQQKGVQPLGALLLLLMAQPQKSLDLEMALIGNSFLANLFQTLNDGEDEQCRNQTASDKHTPYHP